LPLSGHDPDATIQAIASECVAELGGVDAFWEVTDVLLSVPYTTDDALADMVTDYGVDKAAFSACLSSGKYDAKVAKDKANADDIGIRGTPGIVLLNNETDEALMVEGAQPLELFTRLIDEMLN
jgi:protein-disulfide isomerase